MPKSWNEADCDLPWRDFFDACASKFDACSLIDGGFTREHRIAGCPVRIRIAGQGLMPLLRPLAHLAVADNSPSSRLAHSIPVAGSPLEPLEIMAWDSRQFAPPAPPWQPGQQMLRGELVGWQSERFRIHFDPEHCLLCLYDRATRRAIYWLDDAANLPFWEHAAPFRMALHAWSSDFGGQITHAAAVGKQGLGVLLVGKGGSGKSTTSVACLQAGLDFVGDDYVLLTHDPSPRAHSLYNAAKIHTPFLRRSLPAWQPHVAMHVGPERKSVVFVHESSPQQVVPQLAIAAALVPCISHRHEATMEPAGRSRVLLAAAPTTMYQLPGNGQESMSFLAKFLGAIDCRTLHLSSDLGSAPRCIAQWLDEQLPSHEKQTTPQEKPPERSPPEHSRVIQPHHHTSTASKGLEHAA